MFISRREFAGLLAVFAQQRPIIDDPLTNGRSKVAKHIVGGEFGSKGWHAKVGSDNLYYELPEGVLSAAVEFEIKGQVVGEPLDHRKHVVIVADRYLGPGADYNSRNSTEIMLRVWSKDNGPSKAGKIRLRTVGLAYGKEDEQHKFQRDSQPLTWAPDKWHKLRIAWTQRKTIFERDGALITTIEHPDKQVPFRHVLLNTGSYANGLKGLIGITYRNLKIYTPARF